MKKLDFICAKLVRNRDNVPQIGTKSSKTSVTETVDNDLDENGGRTEKADDHNMESEVNKSEIRDLGCATPDTTESCPISTRNKRKNFVPKMAKSANERNRASQDNKIEEFDSSNKNEDANFLSIDEEYEFENDQDQNGEDSAAKSAPKIPLNLRTTSRRSCAKTLIDSYIVRFFGSECGAEACYDVPPREHFHCKLCDFRLFSKKEDMLRHFKWHKKREESMANGFMRFSATDDCSERYDSCIHNLRQTHYHCMNKGCCKVYISTSDVQIHSNSHKKAASIAKEGFQRFKNCEDCCYDDCPFHDPANRTTHFHCLRPGCSHSFKNKADMDKHKTHHQRDDLFYKDGFKKFMKCETCSFTGCAFSRVVNHIHCLKPGCDYILHSTSQMYAHKRKHEKQEKRFATSISPAANQGSPSASSSSKSCRGKSHKKNSSDQGRYSTIFDGCSKRNSSAPSCSTVDDTASDEIYDVNDEDSDNENNFGRSAEVGTEMMNNMSSDNDDLNQESAPAIDLKTLDQPIKFMSGIKDDTNFKCNNDFKMCKNVQPPNQIDLYKNTDWINKSRNDDIWKKYITRYTANDPCKLRCPLMYKDHYHCTADENCETFFKSKDGVRDHAKQHELLEFASKFFRTTFEDSLCNFEQCPYSSKLTHYHCLIENCTEIITVKESVFRRLEHHKLHEYSNNLGLNSNFQHSNSTSSIIYPYNQTKLNTTPPNSEMRQDEKMDEFEKAKKHVVSDNNVSSGQTNFFVGEFRRKRGRPPKYANNEWRLQKIPISGGNTTGIVASSGSSRTNRPKPVVSLKSQRGRPRTVSSPRHPENADFIASTSSNFFRIDDHYHPSSSFGKPLQTDGFTTYLAGDQCPDQLCKLASKLHFHCNQLRCYYSTDQQNVLEMHSQDFHQTFEIPDGFAAYDKMYNCRGSPGCPFNGRFRHFHCLRISCNFEPLLKFHDLLSHTNLKHFSSSSPSSSSSSSISSPPQETSIKKIIKTAGAVYPKISSDRRISTAEEVYNVTSNDACLAEGFVMLTQMAPFFAEFGMQSLMQKRVPYTVERQCGRPFCKLKRRDHFHCSQCHQGFSHYDRLVSHMLKHGVTLPQTQMSLRLNSPNTVQSHQVPNNILYNNLRPSVINVPPIVSSTDSEPSRTANQMKYQVFKAAPTRHSSTNKIEGGFPTVDRNLAISNRQSENGAKIVATNKAGKVNIQAKKRKLVSDAAQKMSDGQLLVQNYDIAINSISPDLVSN